jgi:hypothetical protein
METVLFISARAVMKVWALVSVMAGYLQGVEVCCDSVSPEGGAVVCLPKEERIE